MPSACGLFRPSLEINAHSQFLWTSRAVQSDNQDLLERPFGLQSERLLFPSL
jgi:hypothetical protein